MYAHFVGGHTFYDDNWLKIMVCIMKYTVVGIDVHWIYMPSCPNNHPDNKVHWANMGPTWVLSAPDGPHVGPINLAIRALLLTVVLGLIAHV